MRKYRFIISVISVLLLVAAVFSIFAGRIVTAAAKGQLKKSFPGSEVYIAGCNFNPARGLAFKDIEIKTGKIYDFKIKDLRILYNIPSILRGGILGVYLGDSSFAVDLGRKDISEIQNIFSGGQKGAFNVENISISNLNLKLRARDIEFIGSLSSEVDLNARLIKHIDLKIDSLEAKGVSLEGAHIKGWPADTGADLYIKKAKYSDVMLSDASGKAYIKGGTVFLKTLKAGLFGGYIDGNIDFDADKTARFVMNVNFTALDIGTFVKELKMDNKFQMTGKLNGAVALEGEGLAVTGAAGNFLTDPEGGLLVIKDTSFLENMARESKKPLEVVMEGFKNYQYNTGIIKLTLGGNDLVLSIQLDGQAGKRDFNVILHDVIMGKRRML